MKSIETELFVKMLDNAVLRLRDAETQMNKTNVYPVADGDTGTNMLYTLSSAIRKDYDRAEGVSLYLAELNKAMFLNCRGNSGNILAQIFKGFEIGLNKAPEIDVSGFINMIEQANISARKVVDDPKEGTILTMLSTLSSRLALTEKIKECTIGEFLEIVVFYAYHALLETRFQLYENRINKVEDSGARGLFEIFRAMAETVSCGESSGFEMSFPKQIEPMQNVEALEEDLKDRFCFEFVIALGDPEGFSDPEFKTGLSALGSSAVVLRNENNIKVHVHTNDIDSVSSYASNFGRVEIVKIDDMNAQKKRTETNEYDLLSEKIKGVVGEESWSEISSQRKEVLFCKMLKCLPYMDDRDYCLSVLTENGYKCLAVPGWQTFNTKKIKLNWSSLLGKTSDHEEMVFLFLPDSGIWKKSESDILRDFEAEFPDLELKIIYGCKVNEPAAVVFD